MIFRLEYCNKASVTARVDIQKGAATPVYTVEGTAEPFTLFYNNYKNDKSGSFRSSGADINIYETTDFNIDELKTSNETEISVKYYINNVLNWSGFVIPDFFSETITGGQGVVSMVASDRLSTLKGATLSGLSEKVSNRALAEACLAQTGLSLPLYTMADFTGDGTNIFNSEVLSQRMVDTKGRNVSCYDILSSILEETNSLIVQRNGAWYIVNKLQLEAGSGSLYSAPATSSAWVENTVSFDEVSVGARRTITPVAATVGVYHEHGGGRLHPDNYDFTKMLSGWSTAGGFNAAIGDKLIKEFTAGSSGGATISIVPDNNVTIKPYLINNNEYVRNINPKYIESANIDIPYTGYGVININVDVNATGPAIAHPSRSSAFMRIAVVAIKGTTVKTLDHGGAFIDMPSANPPVFAKEFERGTDFTNIRAVTSGMIVNGKLEIPEGDSFSNWKIRVRVYGGGGGYDVAFNSTMVKLSLSATDSPKGNIFKTTQGANYTKDHEIPTVLWGDYLTSGLNGYFYDYAIDDTSSLYRPTGELHSKWTAYGDPDTLPLLQHITRQKARMFSVAHDLLSADIATSTFDPLSIFVSCEGTSDETRYVVVSARFDFLRSNVSVELEEVAYATNSKRDYIYSYFGEGESGISSVGGISSGAGGGGGGGGLTSEQLAILNNLASWWKLDEANDAIYSEKNVYSEKGVSAYGHGVEGSGGGGYDMLLSWVDYTEEKANWVISAALGKGLLDRIVVLEDGGGGGGSTVTWGTESGGYVPLTVEGVSKSVALSTHTHSQYALNTALTDHINNVDNPHSVTKAQVGLGNVLNVASYSKTESDTNLTSAIDDIEIGGRNLLISSSWWGAYTPYNTVPIVSNNGRTITFIKNAIGSTAISKAALPYKADGSIVYTFSGIAKADGVPVTNATWGANKTANTYQPTPLRFLLDDTTGRFEITQKWTVTNQWILHGNIFPFPVGTVITIDDFQIEKGNKSTDWKPAPEDQVSNWSETDVASFSYIKNKPTQLSQFTDNIGVATHIANTSNPHSVTKAQVGLGNVDNTADSAKNVLSATKLTTARTIWGQSFNGEGNVLGALTGATTGSFSASVSTPKVDFGNGFTIEPSGTELVFKYNGVIKQRMLSDGSIVATGELTGYVAAT